MIRNENEVADVSCQSHSYVRPKVNLFLDSQTYSLVSSQLTPLPLHFPYGLEQIFLFLVDKG